MGWSQQRRLAARALLIASLVIEGCTSAVAVWPETQSRVTYPYEKIVALGETRGATTGYDLTFSGIPNFIDPHLGREAVLQAVRSQRGDLLVDYTLSLYLTGLSSPFNLTVFGVPLIPNFWIISWIAEGTAAKIEVSESEQPVPALEKPSSPAGERR